MQNFPVQKGLCGKCIVRQSSAKFDKVDMFSKQAIKKQSWQSWCIFLSIFKNIMQSKVGKVEISTFLIMGKVHSQGKVGKVGNTFGLI